MEWIDSWPWPFFPLICFAFCLLLPFPWALVVVVVLISCCRTVGVHVSVSERLLEYQNVLSEGGLWKMSSVALEIYLVYFSERVRSYSTAHKLHSTGKRSCKR